MTITLDDFGMNDKTLTDKRNKQRVNGRPLTDAATHVVERTSFLSRHQTIINFWLDSVLLVNFCGLLWVAVVIQFIFPPAEASAGYALWGLSLSRWMDVQFGVLSVFCVGILLHLMMHWSWVCGVLGSRFFRKVDGKKHVMDDGQRTILGVALMIVLLNIMGLGIAFAALAIRSPS